MKKLFETLGIFSLLCISFIYTEKTVTVVKEFDDIMVEIKEQSKKNSKQTIEAVIDNDTIIPGISGYEIDTNNSYSKMKRYGRYNDKLLTYTKVKPKDSIYNNMNKYIISGNKEKNMVSFMFLVEENDNIDKILKILETKKITATFFLDGNFVEKNSESLIQIVNKGHDIGNLSYSRNYLHHSYAWLDTKIKQVSKQKNGYCYSDNSDKTVLNICQTSSNFTIKPNLIIKNYPLKEIKGCLQAGNLISLPVTQIVVDELPVIISFIESKGYEISNLTQHLKEE